MSFMNWIDERFPATKVWNEHLAQYYAPKNFNFWYFFGSLAMLVLVLQIVTGVWLAMLYKPSAEDAFASVEYIMRDVDYGWLLRYLHSTGASAFFLVVYLHMFRGLIYGSHRRPRELLWIIGVIIYVAMMATAFMGYLLPWGQMSYWGAQVIVNLFAAFPFGIGEPLSIWIRGDYVISDATLNRFFALHFLSAVLCLRRWCSSTSWHCTRWVRTTPTVSRSRRTRTKTASRKTVSRSTRTTPSRTSSASGCS